MLVVYNVVIGMLVMGIFVVCCWLWMQVFVGRLGFLDFWIGQLFG